MLFFLKVKTLSATAAAADWLWDLKKTVDAWFIIGKQKVFFQRGLWGDFLNFYGSKRAEDPPPPPKKR